jgi:hypothetical protein
MVRAPAFIALYRAEARSAAVARLGTDPVAALPFSELLRDSAAEYVDHNLRYRVGFGLFPGRPDHVALITVPRNESMLKWRDVVNLVPLTFHFREFPGLESFPPTDPQRCYLDLISPSAHLAATHELGVRPVAAVLASAMHRHLPADTVRSFSLHLGVRASVTHSDKLLAHVAAHAPGAAAYGAMELLRWLPAVSRVGALEEDEAPIPAPAGPTPAGPLGTVAHPLVRRFAFEAGLVATATNLDANAETTRYLTFDPHSGPVRDWAQWHDTLRWDSLAVHFLPLNGARWFHVDLRAVWFPAHRPAPTAANEFDRLPGRRRLILASGDSGDLPPQHTISCGQRDGVSFFVTPAPTYGGTARLALLFTARALETVIPQDLYAVEFELVADARVPGA